MTSLTSSLTLKLNNMVSQPLLKINDSFKNLTTNLKGVSNSTSGIEKLLSLKFSTEAIDGVANASKNLLRSLGGEAIRFESSMAEVQKTVSAIKSPEQLKEFQTSIEDMTNELPLTKEQIATIVASAGQMGIGVGKDFKTAKAEILAFTKDASKMSIAFDISADKAGDSMGHLRSMLKLNQDQVVSLADSMNYLANNDAAYASQILNVEMRSGSTAKALGLTNQTASAMGASLLGMGTQAEVSGSSLDQLYKSLNSFSSNKKFKNDLQQLGYTTSSFGKALKTDANMAIVEFLKRVGKSKDPISTLRDLMGDQGSTILKLAGNYQKLSTNIKNANDVNKTRGSMEAEFSSLSSTTQNQLIKYKALD